MRNQDTIKRSFVNIFQTLEIDTPSLYQKLVFLSRSTFEDIKKIKFTPEEIEILKEYEITLDNYGLSQDARKVLRELLNETHEYFKEILESLAKFEPEILQHLLLFAFSSGTLTRKDIAVLRTRRIIFEDLTGNYSVNSTASGYLLLLKQILVFNEA